jgi:hypothetical protein
MKTKTPSSAVKRTTQAPRVAKPRPQLQPKMPRASVQKQALPAKSAGKVASASGPVSAAISMVFQKDAAVRSAITEQLKKRIPTAVDVSRRAKKLFENFKPSSHPPSMRAAPNFLAPGGHLPHAQQGAMDRSLEALRKSPAKRTMTLRQTEALGSLIQTKKKSGDGAAVATISLSKLISYLNTNVPAGRLLARSSPIDTSKAQIEAKAAMKSITHADSSEAQKNNDATTSDFSHLTATQVVKDNVGLQMKTATSPESQVMYAIPNKNPTGNIDTFELRQGPSDVTSYHDLNTLQIAFESVWTELFDGQAAALGEQLYGEYVKLKQFTGTDDGKDPNMSTLEDLANLMDTIKSFTDTIADSLPPNLQPSGTSQGSDTSGLISPDGVTRTGLDIVTGGVSEVIEWAIDQLVKLGNNPVKVTWSSFPLTLDQNDSIELVSIEEDAVNPSTVAIFLETDQGSYKKKITFQQWDPDTQNSIFSADIQNWPPPKTEDHVVLNSAQIASGTLTFSSEDKLMNEVILGRYVLGNLAEKLKDRTKVTFHWKGNR